MASGKKIVVPASSVVGLKAELARKTEEYEREKTSSLSSSSLGGGSSRSKGGSKWATAKAPAAANSGVAARAAKDEAAHAQEQRKRTWEGSIETLEKGARLYDKLQRGELEISEDVEENSLVDFARKRMDAGAGPAGWLEASEAEKAVETDDPWVEYEDEFGRSRTCRQSQVPDEIKELQRRKNADKSATSGFVRGGSGDSGDDDDEDAPPPRKKATLVEHYDGDEEVRNKGVGFFQFSRDEAERAQQLRDLNALRAQTLAQQSKATVARTTSKLAARLEAAKKKQQIAANLDSSNPAKMAELQAKADSFLESMEKELQEKAAQEQQLLLQQQQEQQLLLQQQQQQQLLQQQFYYGAPPPFVPAPPPFVPPPPQYSHQMYRN